MFIQKIQAIMMARIFRNMRPQGHWLCVSCYLNRTDKNSPSYRFKIKSGNKDKAVISKDTMMILDAIMVIKL